MGTKTLCPITLPPIAMQPTLLRVRGRAMVKL